MSPVQCHQCLRRCHWVATEQPLRNPLRGPAFRLRATRCDWANPRPVVDAVFTTAGCSAGLRERVRPDYGGPPQGRAGGRAGRLRVGAAGGQRAVQARRGGAGSCGEADHLYAPRCSCSPSYVSLQRTDLFCCRFVTVHYGCPPCYSKFSTLILFVSAPTS